MTPVTFPSSLVIQGAPYKVYRNLWSKFIDRLIANNWTLEGNKIPVEADYDNLSDNKYMYAFFHTKERYISLVSHEEYRDMGINAYIEFVQ